MQAKVFYKASIEKDLKRIDAAQARKIIDRFESAMASGEKGEPLKGSFEGLFRFRVGDYRLIYSGIKDGILVLRVSHRKDVYR